MIYLLLIALLSIPLLRLVFFPRVEFAVGNGKHRNASMECIRLAIIVGLAINLLASVIVGVASLLV